MTDDTTLQEAQKADKLKRFILVNMIIVPFIPFTSLILILGLTAFFFGG